MEEQMTYADIVHNWGVLEQYIVKTRINDPASATYDHLIQRVSEWLFSEPVLDNLPPFLEEEVVSRKSTIQQLLLSKHIIPSSPILEHGGREVTPYRTNYFSYYNIENFETFTKLSSLAKAGTEIGYQPLLSDETSEGLIDLFEDTSDQNISFTVREDGGLFNKFINTKGGTPQRNFVYYHEFLNYEDKIVRALDQAKYIGITLAQNVKRNSIIANSLNPYYSTSKPGYMGLNGTACPMFYVNAAHLICEAGEYDKYISHVNHAGFCAALLANVILYQQDGYLTSDVLDLTLKNRPIGVGIMGLHSAMIRCDVPYESSTGITFASQTQASLTLGTMAASSMLMKHVQKSERVGHDSSRVAELLRRCTDEISGMELVLEELESIGVALEKHGCMYNLTSTVQGYDPNLAGLLGISTEGIEPLLEIEMTRIVEGNTPLTLFPLEIFDNTHAMTCNLQELREQTYPYISPKYKMSMINAIQRLSHSPVASDIIFPADANAHAMSTVMSEAHSAGLYHLKMYKGNYALQKRSYTKENAPEPELEVESIEVNGESYSIQPEVPSYFGQCEPNEEEPLTIEPSIEVADAKVYKIKSPNLLLHLTVTDDGKYVNIDAPSNGHATSFSISEALSQLTLSGRTNDGNNTTGD